MAEFQYFAPRSYLPMRKAMWLTYSGKQWGAFQFG